MAIKRDRERARAPDILPAIAGIAEVCGFQDRLGQLLDEQRHAVGLAEDKTEQRNMTRNINRIVEPQLR